MLVKVENLIHDYKTCYWMQGVEPTFFQIMRDIFGDMTSCLTCKIAGHKMVDHSSAGPDSGSVDVECQRCGYSFHQQLY